MSDLTDLVDRFRRGPSVLAAALEGVSEAESNFSPAPGKWTIREIAQHLADTEIVAGMRLRQMLAEDKPALVMFNQDAWAKELGYAKCEPSESLAQFRALREINASLIALYRPRAGSRGRPSGARHADRPRLGGAILRPCGQSRAADSRHPRSVVRQAVRACLTGKRTAFALSAPASWTPTHRKRPA